MRARPTFKADTRSGSGFKYRNSQRDISSELHDAGTLLEAMGPETASPLTNSVAADQLRGLARHFLSDRGERPVYVFLVIEDVG